MGGDSIFNNIRSKAANISGSINIEKIAETYDSLEHKISQIKDKAFEYIPDINIDSIEEKLSFIGYRIPRIEIAVTIPPRIAFEIDLEKSIINEEEKEKILSEPLDLKDNNITYRVLVKIIQGLDQAIKLRDKLHFKNKKLSRVSIEGSLIPTVKLIYLDIKEVQNEAKLD